jgi:hypothetical protein
MREQSTVVPHGNEFISSLSLSLTPGLYWVTATYQGGTPTINAWIVIAGYMWNGQNPNFGASIGFSQSGVTGALPTTFSGAYIDTASAPLVLVGF